MMRESMTTILSAFSEKQNSYRKACMYFCHVTLIISNEKFQFQSQLRCENLKCLLPAYNLQKLLLPFQFIQGKTHQYTKDVHLPTCLE